MVDRGEGVLRRWARLKTETQRPDDPAAPAPAEPETPPAAATRPTAAPAAETEADATVGGPETEESAPPDLPDIESLDETSDFSAFMKDGVPEQLKTRALRRLWRLDPAFAQVDGLLEYDDDFTDAALVIEGLKTAYKVGKGMRDDETETAEDARELAASDGSSEAATPTGAATEAGPERGETPADDPIANDASDEEKQAEDTTKRRKA